VCTIGAFHLTGIDFAMEVSVELKILTDISGLRLYISWHIVHSCDTIVYMILNVSVLLKGGQNRACRHM
jgi:hypothetical protein